MPTYEVEMRVTYGEVWSVEAETFDEARKLIMDCDDAVVTDDTGGEVMDWIIDGPIKKVSE